MKEMSPGDTWYSNNYLLALQFGLLTSDELDGGELTSACTRQEMAMLLVRAAYQGAAETADSLVSSNAIPDYDAIHEYYRQYVLQAYSMGFLAGVDSIGTFQPGGQLTRAQAATVIYRLLDPSARMEISRTGEESYSWRDGTTYAGQIQNGEANGYGKMIFPNIGTYIGYFVNGRREGLGTFRWDVGDTYVGFWSNDKMTGTGTYTFSDGYAIRGLWQDNHISADSLYMSPSSLVIAEGATEQIVALVEPEQITEIIEWNSDNTEIVSVTGVGNLCVVTAQSVGTATVTAKTASGKSTICAVSVIKPSTQLRQIQLNYGDYTAKIGNVIQLEAELTPSNATNSSLTWSSSNPSVASVSSSGVVNANTRGTAIISCKAASGLIASCHFIVEDLPYEMWSDAWTVYASTAGGIKTGSSDLGTCRLNVANMTAYFTMSPFTGKYIDLNPRNSYEMSGLLEAGTNSYELTFTSIRDALIVLEVKAITDSNSSSDSVVVNYYALKR